jgi:hypothetical protein
MPDNTAWLIDGPLTKAELARKAHFAASGGAEGIAGLNDLKVITNSTPGNGVRVMPGSATVLNRYITPVNQSYVVSNPAIWAVPSGSMPPSNPSARSHLVAAVVGDPQYSATGHPFMPGTAIPEDELDTFQYVRFVVIPNVPSTTTRFSQLGLNYPGLELARLDVPANTTTITADMIKDLRRVARPRTKDVQWHVWATDNDVLNVTPLTYEVWPDASAKQVEVPEWASMCYVDGFINGFVDGNSTQTRARIRVSCLTAPGGAIATSYTQYDESALGKKNVNLGGTMKIPAAMRGTTQQFEISATTLGAGDNEGLATVVQTSCMVHLRFVEEPD